MRHSRASRPIVVVGCAGLLLASLTPGSSVASERSGFPPVAHELHGGPSTLWVSRYEQHGGSSEAVALATSPDGSTVYVTGKSDRPAGYPDVATVAYQASTGRRLWVQRYGRHGRDDEPTALVVSPDGSMVFVTGGSGTSTDSSFVTVAYDAQTGDQRWVRRFTPQGSGFGWTAAMAISPDGSTVFVTGYDVYWGGGQVVAYQASTGADAWDALADLAIVPSTLAVSPDGSRIVVSSAGDPTFGAGPLTTLALSAVDGTEVWESVHPGNGAGATSLKVSPNGKMDFATGFIFGATRFDTTFITIAYRASTGAEIWVAFYATSGRGRHVARAMTLSPEGATLLVTGESPLSPVVGGGPFGVLGFATVAYRATTGEQLWASRYEGPGDGEASPTALDVSPDGSMVLVAGYDLPARLSGDLVEYATVSYRASSGRRLWVRHYHVAATGMNMAHSVKVSPDGSLVFVTGQSAGTAGTEQFATIAYQLD